jgi:nucleoside-diphosphate-sugar epimerase
MNDNNCRVFVTGGSGFIGTALVSRLLAAQYEVTNFDIAAPCVAAHAKYWIPGNILDRQGLQTAMSHCSPAAVIHLAARTDTFSQNLDDYRVNTEGSANVIEACKQQKAVESFVLTSSQFVFGPFGQPKNDEDFRPHTVYGESKCVSEYYLRNSNMDACWTIVRPTNIWGPWHKRYADEFWNVLRRGLYVHPKGPEVIRCYGYVGTVADQIITILNLPAETVNHQVLYLGDPPLRLIEWVNGFSIGITGHRVREVPYAFLRIVALAGDGLQAITGRVAPLSSSRLQSMTESYVTPMAKTFEILGPPRQSLHDGIDETVRWLREVHPRFRTGPAVQSHSSAEVRT